VHEALDRRQRPGRKFEAIGRDESLARLADVTGEPMILPLLEIGEGGRKVADWRRMGFPIQKPATHGSAEAVQGEVAFKPGKEPAKPGGDPGWDGPGPCPPASNAGGLDLKVEGELLRAELKALEGV
jgi:hypothetical protein